MTTNPINSILPLELDENIETLLNQLGEALQELVCFGTHILDKSLKKNEPVKENATEIDLVKDLLFRHIVELADALSVQIPKGINAPCKIHLRAILEATMSLEYILEKDTAFRAGCYLITDFYKRLKSFEKLIPGTEANKMLLADLKKHSKLPEIFNKVDATKEYNKMKTLINKPHYANANQAYLTYINAFPKKKSSVNWFSIVDKSISDIYSLAKELKRQEQYIYLYKNWSDSTHGSGIWPGVFVKGDDEYGAISQLRNPREAGEMATACITLSLFAFSDFIDKVMPQEKQWFRNWYQWYDVIHRNKIKIN